jgi:sulfur relay (sulfurtransferase) complex TusBCD TusD component (DsrE family)
MVTFAFIVCTEAYKFEAMDTLLNIATAIIDRGHQISGIFFYGSGVYNVKRDINVGSSMRNLPEKLETLIKEKSIKVLACSTWINFVGLKEEEFISGACQEGLSSLSELLAKSDRVIAFSTGG